MARFPSAPRRLCEAGLRSARHDTHLPRPLRSQPMPHDVEPDRRDAELHEQLEPVRDYDEFVYFPKHGDPLETVAAGISFSAHVPMPVERALTMEIIEGGVPKQIPVVDLLSRNPHFRITGATMSISSEHVSVANTVALALQELQAVNEAIE